MNKLLTRTAAYFAAVAALAALFAGNPVASVFLLAVAATCLSV